MSDITTKPARRVVAITGSDQVLAEDARYILVGVAGNLNCKLADEDTAHVLPVQAGMNALCVKEIVAASTTATGMWACYTN